MQENDNLDKRVGKNIQRIRKEQDMTQDELAQKIGAIKQTVSKIERGIYSPTFKVLIEICNVLHTTPNELLLVDTKWLEWKEENIKKTGYSIEHLADEINIFEDLWANADLCKEKGDTKGELFYLDRFIQTQVGSDNTYYRTFAEFLYKKRIDDYMDKSIKEVRKNKINNLKTKGS